ncbi:glutamine synthetase family protein [Poseidonocella sp. HB161398]|uniref:glutamine synthetase family protein n=1 Tax=Poseidonocella sp. HB161398 TaxID=2320855 RepID=UPI001108C251|nr:glutamine synthetase family protein [Poseidonocella sp. HB161398]
MTQDTAPLPAALTGIVTTDVSAVTRGRFVPASRLPGVMESGIGWLQANLSLTPFGTIADPNPWGSTGDLRILPDPGARFLARGTGSETPFDMMIGNITELDGTPWPCCTRSMLADALGALHAATGLSMTAAFEHEFQLFGHDLPQAHVLSFAGLRRADGFAARLVSALSEAGVDPEVIISEFGRDQFEITHAPAPALAAADRSVAIREITRELARNLGWQASFAPKTAPDAVGNGLHIHFSFTDDSGAPAGFDPAGPGRLSAKAGAFCAGVLRHLPAILPMTASSVPSYLRLKPHGWSASYTWLAEQDREASLRICPTVSLGGKDPAKQFNIEFRAADSTANPYLALAAIVRAGLEGLRAELPVPPLVTGDPEAMSPQERAAKGLHRLPGTLPDALAALAADPVVSGWFPPVLLETFHGEKEAEIAHLAGMDPEEICRLYRTLF